MLHKAVGANSDVAFEQNENRAGRSNICFACFLANRELKVTEPFLLRETPLRLAPLVKEQYPDARVFPQYRMDVTRSTFKPQHKGLARPLRLDDAPALAGFFGAPPKAAKGFEGWLRGSKLFYGIFESSQLVAIGSSMVSIPESWNLVSIETHKDFRGRGPANAEERAWIDHGTGATP